VLLCAKLNFDMPQALQCSAEADHDPVGHCPRFRRTWRSKNMDWVSTIGVYAGTVVIAGCVIEYFLRMLRCWMIGRDRTITDWAKCVWRGHQWAWCAWHNEQDGSRVRGVPPWLTGVVERLVFTTVAAASPQDAPTLMAAWVGLKFAANWQRDLLEKDDAKKLERIRLGFSALLVDLASMFIAWLGGYYIHHHPPSTGIAIMVIGL
jgi:hypothetical protein